MRRKWVVWCATTLFFALYLTAAYIESYLVEVPIKIEAGSITKVKLVRLADDPLSMKLAFAQIGIDRPELGFPEIAEPWPASREKRYLRPGSEIRLRVTTGSQSVLYEAEPSPNYGIYWRDLTSDLSIAPGVWRWPPPPDLAKIILRPVVTELSIEVLSVDKPLAGESARIFVIPPLSFKKSKKDIGWVGFLWFAWLWFIIIPVQLIWGAWLLLTSFR